MSRIDDLPVLYSVRCWSDGPLGYVDEMSATGVEVVDVYVSPIGFRDLGEWADAVIDCIVTRHDPAMPLHFLAYSGGGNLLLAALHRLESAGIFPEFVAFIDTRRTREAKKLAHGLDSLYLVPWGVRLRQAFIRLTPPGRESLGSVLKSVVRRSVRSVIDLPNRGWRSRKRRDPKSFPVLRLAYPWEFEGVVTPVHLYNTQDSIHRFGADDPSLQIGRYLWGGFVIRYIEGTHLSCIESPHSTALIERITADRLAVITGNGWYRRLDSAAAEVPNRPGE